MLQLKNLKILSHNTIVTVVLIFLKGSLTFLQWKYAIIAQQAINNVILNVVNIANKTNMTF